MTIAQITDLHMHTGLSYDTDVQKNFQRVLENVAGNTIDLIVLTGDLVFRETYDEVYILVKQRLDATGIPYRIVPGNHDHIPTLCRVFGMTPQASGELYGAEKTDDAFLLFLDSSTAACSRDQLTWFKKTVSRAGGEIIVFMHHPPCPMGVPFMDRTWPFTMSDEFQTLVRDARKQVTVFCGHYHTDTYVRCGNLQVFVCPAVLFQFDPLVNEYKIESRGFGWRKIVLSQGRLSTSVRFINSS